MNTPIRPQTPIYIFDLDGTLADNSHRTFLIDREGKPKDFKPNWDAYFDACDADMVHWPTVGVFLQLYNVGVDLRIWTGRRAKERGKTLVWLHAVTRINLSVLDHMLRMRDDDDFTPDHQLKRKWLRTMQPVERQRVSATFEDRASVVKMWREEGVTCFQCAEGDF
jgi:hypothetical protein